MTEPKWRPGPRKVTSKVLDERGRELSAAESARRYEVLGLGPRTVDPMVVAVEATQDKQDLSPQETERRRAAAIRNTFGSTVIINGEFVTKRYFMAGEAAGIFKKLIGAKPPAAGKAAKLGGKDGIPCVLGTMMRDKQVELSYVEGFEEVPGLAYTGPVGKKGPLIAASKATAKNDLVLVTAKVDGLLAFERAIDLVFRNIPQVEIDVKVVEFSSSDSLSFGAGGGDATNADPPAVFSNLSGSKLVNTITSSFPLSPPAGSGLSSKGLFELGGIHDSWQLDATLQVLAAQGKADVLSNPRLVVRNGGTAVIATFTEFPFPKAKIVGVNSSTDVAFRPVGITLGIKPIIAGTDTVILQIHADVSAVTGFADTEVVPTPIVSTRTAITQVHVTNGKATVIGGLRSRASFDNESKIPILGDIPILGYLFRQSTSQTSETDLQFFITPRIRVGSQDELAR